MKLVPLTNDEIALIEWTIWEPLRRNQEYINDWSGLNKEPFPDPAAKDEFCEKWKIAYPVDPDCCFDGLYGPLDGESQEKADSRIRILFQELYLDKNDNAAFVNDNEWIVNDHYLNVFINLKRSRNKIEAEIKKILDEWLSESSKSFYNIKNESEARLSESKGERRFKIWDMVEKEGKIIQMIAFELCLPPKTVYRNYKEAWESIYKKSYRERKESKTATSLDSAFRKCEKCENRICEESGILCPEIEKYASQDHGKLQEKLL